MPSAHIADGSTKQVHQRYVHPSRGLSRIVWWVFGAIEVLIALRFVLELFGANAQAPFVVRLQAERYLHGPLRPSSTRSVSRA
jgi:hypothetical protein